MADEPTTYTTISGDTWDAIAYAQMGDERYMHLLVLANPAHAYIDRFPAGIVLTIPEVPEAETSTSLPPWMRP
jgi:phage tail protein X